MPSPVPRSHRMTASDLFRGLGSLLVLALLLVGIPAALIVFAGNPLPDHLPTAGEIGEALSGPDSGEVFLGVLVAIGWLCWAGFALSVVIEIPAQLHHRPALHLPALGWSQAIAAGLLAAIFSLVLSSAAARPAAATPGSNTTPPPAPPAATQPVTPQPADVTPAPPKAEAAPATHTVQPRETLWGLAEQYLGDGARFNEIVDLNLGVEQPDGGSLSDGNRIRPGWILTLPATPITAPTADVHVVEAGETLAGIAHDELGDASLYPQIVDANAGVVQPDGQTLTDPDVIDVGWQLHIPAAQPPAAGDIPTTPAAPPPATPPAEPPAAQPSEPSPPTSAPAPPSPPSTAQPIQTAESTGSSTDQHSPVAADDVDDSELTTVIGVGLLGAAGLLTLLGLKRMKQQRRRRPGHRILLPDPPLTSIELSMRAVEEPDLPILLDQALRSLTVTAAASGRDIPTLVAARLHGGRLQVTVHGDADDTPIAPFAATSEPGVWQLDTTHPGPLDSVDAAATPAPYPTLVTVGVDEDGAQVLVDLEQAGAITLSGAPARIRACLATLAIELATAPWADHLIAHLVGFAPDLPSAIAGDRLRYSSNLDDVLTAMEGRAEQINQLLADAGAGDVHTARATAVADDTWTPEILLTAEPLTGDQLQRISRIVQVSPPTSLAAVITAATDDHVVPGPWQINVDDDPTWIEPLGRSVRLHRLTDTRYRSLIAVLTAANDTSSIPAEDWSTVPPEPEILPDPDPDDSTEARSGSMFATDRHTTTQPVGVVDSDNASPFTSAAADIALISLPALSVAPAHPQPTATAQRPDWPHEHADDLPSDSPFAGPIPTSTTTEGATAGPDDAAADNLDRDENNRSAAVSTLDPAAPEIQLLGPVRIAGAHDGRVDSNKRARLLELAVYMLLRPGRDHAEISRAMGTPGKPWTPSTRQSYTSRLRAWLGEDTNGETYVPLIVAGQGYRLAEAVRCDWTRFQALAQRGLRKGSPAGAEDLEHALGLVRGAPFGDAGHRRYGWAEPYRQEMISRIVDIAHTLGLWRLQQHQPEAARRALAIGLDVEPTSELLYRGLLRAEYQAGNRVGIIAAADRLAELNDRLEVDMEDETAELLRQLKTAPHTHVAGK